MGKVRIYELAKILELDNKEMMKILSDLNFEVKSHMSSLDDEMVEIVRKKVLKKDTVDSHKKTKTDKKSFREELTEESKVAPVAQLTPEYAQPAAKRVKKIKPLPSIRDVAEAIGISAAEAVKTLISKGLMLAATATADDKVLDIFSEKYNVRFEKEVVVEPRKEITPQPKHPGKKKHQPKGALLPRAPIVAVMGHVDHGKTTLLDSIRNTNVTKREAGGITQHIGASVVKHDGKKIVFLDTPGHEAFTAMRARGAQATDVVILVVAADDGIMPQTREAIAHVKAAGVPIVVAVNKVDKPSARPDRVRQQLSDVGLVPEEWGGDVIMVDVSAKFGEGLPNLLEMLLLVAEMQELKADPTAEPSGVVIEAELDKGKGPVATVVVQNGTLRRGDVIIFDTAWGKIRALVDASGKPTDKAGPSTPVEILGLASVPQPGEKFVSVDSEREAREMLSKKQQEATVLNINRRASLEGIFSQMKEGEMPRLNLVVKCDVQGSAEALSTSLEKLGTNEVGINILHKGVGRISEADVTLATAANAVIIGFNVRPDVNAKKIAEENEIEIRFYDIIYNAIEDVKSALEGLLKPTLREESLGEVEIRKVFRVPKIGKVAGCYVKSGIIRRTSRVRVVRGGIVLWDGGISSLRRIKDEVREVRAGLECGINLAGFQDFEEEDILEAYEILEEKRHLQ
ncbi:MAG: translation initiation factor IF-2 [Synergistaceae bacterium]|nr:translation initiation factor IF-2 [Synergistaceae bacterium]